MVDVTCLLRERVGQGGWNLVCEVGNRSIVLGVGQQIVGTMGIQVEPRDAGQVVFAPVPISPRSLAMQARIEPLALVELYQFLVRPGVATPHLE